VDIRAALAHEDAPDDVKYKARQCEGNPNKCCGSLGSGPDPCKGCKVKAHLEYRPKYSATLHSSFLAWYVETFKPDPARLSWFDTDLLQLYQSTRAEYRREKDRDGE